MKSHYYKNDILKLCENKHLTVEEIFEEISNIYAEAGKSSIYRNVEEMVSSGELKKVVGIGKKAYFEKNLGDKHIHLVDEESGDIIDLEENIEIKNLPKNFQISGMDIKVFGKFS